MKYIIARSPMGQRLSLVFPDLETHRVMFELLRVIHGDETRAVSAGFISLPEFTCHGESDSMGGLESRGELDQAIFIIGEQAAFLPDEMILPLYHKFLSAKKGY